MKARADEVPGIQLHRQARGALRAAVGRYCAFHGIEPPYDIRRVFDRRTSARGLAPGAVMRVPRAALVDLDDDAAWAAACPADRRWWDIDLYPALAADEGIVGITASLDRSDEPTVKPAGISVRDGTVVVS